MGQCRAHARGELGQEDVDMGCNWPLQSRHSGSDGPWQAVESQASPAAAFASALQRQCV